MISEWGTARLTPAQLAFTFRRLASSLTHELQRFDEVQFSYTRTILVKCQRCVKLQRSLESPSLSNLQSSKLQYDLAVGKQELRAIADEVPLYYLMELAEACEPTEAGTSYPSSASNEGTGSMSLPNEDAGVDEGLMTIEARRKFIRARRRLKLYKILQEVIDGSNPTGAGAPDKKKTSDEEKEVVFRFLADEIHSYLDSIGDGGAPPADASEDPLGGRAFGSNLQVRDGRMTYVEFRKTLFDAGISWLNDEEIHRKFSAMDFDDSGRLSLGEVLAAAARMSQLMVEVHEYEREARKSGRQIAHGELIEEFAETLLLGNDLVGSEKEQLVSDSAITASSYSSQCWCSRLDCTSTPWVADAGDPEPWIQWDFGALRMVTAVKIRGHPERKCWTSSYRLRFLHDIGGEWQCPDQEYLGNDDGNTISQSTLDPPIEAVVVRLYPSKWYPDAKGPALRATLLGFPMNKKTSGTGDVPVPSRAADPLRRSSQILPDMLLAHGVEGAR